MKQITEDDLVIGTKIRIGKKYSEQIRISELSEGVVIELIEGHFEHDNGLYVVNQTAPSIFLGDEFESIYHLFGNDLEYFMDCEIVTTAHPESVPQQPLPEQAP